MCARILIQLYLIRSVNKYHCDNEFYNFSIHILTILNLECIFFLFFNYTSSNFNLMFINWYKCKLVLSLITKLYGRKRTKTDVFVIGNSIFSKGERDCRSYIYFSIGKIHTS